MLAFTIRNAVVIALAQVAIIVAGILGAGATGRILETNPNALMPPALQVLVSYGAFLLVVPLAWITIALLIRRNPRCGDAIKVLTFVSGPVLALTLAIFFIAVVARSFG